MVNDMKNKKILLWGLICLVVLLLIGGGLFIILNKDKNNSEAKEETKQEERQKENSKRAKPLLYKVTKKGTDTVIYLFGSIHMADDRAYPMRDEIINAYNDSEYLAVEFDTIAYKGNMDQMTKDAQGMMYLDGTGLKDHVSEENYNKIVNYLKNNDSYMSMYDICKPVMFYSMVTSIIGNKSGLDSSKGIDEYFLTDAHKNNKKVLEVESADYQMGLFSRYSDRLFEVLTIYMIDQEKEGVQELIDLYEGWLNGDALAIIGETGEEIPEEAMDKYADVEEEMKAFNKELIEQRNNNMLRVVKKYHEDKKNTFVVVGAAHIVGDDGIAKGLEKAGYKVEVIEYK